MHDQTHFETKLADYLSRHAVQADHLRFEISCHSVAEAADAVGATAEDFVKSICFVTKGGAGIVVAIVKGEDRVDRAAVAKAAGLTKLSIASPAEMLAMTGYPAGGTPPLGFEAQFWIDERVLEREVVYAGGGSEYALISIAPDELIRTNGARVAAIRKTGA